MQKIILHGRKIIGGCIEGEALVTHENMCGFGGLDRNTGIVIEKHSDIYGQCIADKVLVLPGAKGSSSFSVFFHFARVNGFAPSAILYNVTTSKMALGAVVTHAPAMTDFDIDPLTVIETGDWVKVDADNGRVEITKKADR